MADRQLFLSVPVTDNDSAIAVPSPGRTIVGELPTKRGRYRALASLITQAPICYVYVGYSWRL